MESGRLNEKRRNEVSIAFLVVVVEEEVGFVR